MTNEQQDKILSLLRKVVIYAHKEKISKEGFIKYSPNEHKWAGTVVFENGSLITYKGMSTSKSKGTYFIKITANDSLGITLKSNNLPIKFMIRLWNFKFRDSVYLDENCEINKYFSEVSFGENFQPNEINIDVAEGVITEIEKLIIFKRIALS